MSLRRSIRRARERAKYGAPLRKIAGLRAVRCPRCRALPARAEGCRKCGGYGWLIENLPDEEPTR